MRFSTLLVLSIFLLLACVACSGDAADRLLQDRAGDPLVAQQQPQATATPVVRSNVAVAQPAPTPTPIVRTVYVMDNGMALAAVVFIVGFVCFIVFFAILANFLVKIVWGDARRGGVR